MVKYLGALLLSLSHLQALPYWLGEKNIKYYIEHFAKEATAEEQERIISEVAPHFSSRGLEAFYASASQEEQERFLITILSQMKPEDRQAFINSLLESFTYSKLMINISEEGCRSVGEAGNPSYLGAMPVIDWLNTAHFNGFFNPTLTNTLVNRDVHNEFDSFNQFGFWIEPFGFYTNFHRDLRPLQFQQYTAGINAGINWTFFDRLVLGLGVAYSHSGTTWHDSSMNAEINSLYFGPAIHYVFSYGYLGMTFFGLANFNHIDRESSLFPVLDPRKTEADFTSYDIVARFDTGLSWTPGGRFYISPKIRLDYLTALEPEFLEPLDEEIELEVEKFQESFLTTKIGLDFSREFYQPKIGFLIPILSFGWINFTPLGINPYTFQIGECENYKKELKINPWSQYYFGIGFTIVHQKAVVIAFNYELTAGVDSPVQAGNLRVELSW